MKKLLHLDRRRVPPSYASHTFLDWWAAQDTPVAESSETKATMALFADTFTTYHEPQHAIAAVRLARRLGASVTVPERVCCGRPLISKGFLDEAAKQGRRRDANAFAPGGARSADRVLRAVVLLGRVRRPSRFVAG